MVEYTVTYRTKSSITTVNTAVLTPPGLDQSGGVDFSAIPGDYSITKKFNSYSAIENTDENTEGHCLLNMNWTMTVDASNGAIPANIQSGDLLGKTWKEWPNQGRWYVYDQPKNDTNLVHYFTASQLETAAENIAVAIDGTSYTGEYYIFASKGFGSTNLNNNPEDAALIKRSDRYTDSGNTYWDEKYMKTLDENAKYGRFYIYFDRDFPEGESFRFDYSTTADVIDGTVSTDLRNEARIMVHNAYRGGQDGQKYNPAARKYDKRNSLLDDTDPKKVPVGTTTSYHYSTSELDYSDSAGTGTNVLSWAIDINLPDYLYYTSNVVITETLPKGLELLQYTVKDSNPPRTNHQYGLFAKLPGFDGSMFYFDEEAVKPTMYSNGAMVIDKDTCTMTKGAYTITAKRISDTEYRIIIPPDMANNIKGKKGTVTVNAHIKDDTEWTGIERDFTNNVTVSTAGDLLGESSHTQVVRRPVIVKESGEINNNTIPYTITINESRDDLVPGYDTLTLTDVLSYRQSSTDNVNAMLDYSSVHVYELDVDGSTIGEITSDCPYTLAEGTSSDGKVTRTIKMTIPDGKALKVEYSYKMSGSGKVSDLSNTATVSGIDSGSDSSNKELEMEIDNTSFGVTLSGVSVYKKDSQNFSLILKGAEFKLEKYNKNNSTWETVQDSNGNDLSCTTGENGMFKIENVDNNTAYRLTETKEPTIAGGNTKDYVLDPTPYYFYIVDNSAPECMPTGFSSGTYVENEITYKVSAVNPGDSITISNRPVGYELPETGGIGTTLYTIGGLVIAGMGVSLLYKNKKCRKEDFASS